MSLDLVGSLAPATTTVRLSLHVLAATIWVGGQFTVAGLLPVVRKLEGDAGKQIARAFAKIEWPAFAVLILTGIWNVSAAGHQSASWSTVLGAKIAIVVVAGVAVIAHSRSKTKSGIAAYGALAGISSIVAVILGVALSG
jgi:putative copper export protein